MCHARGLYATCSVSHPGVFSAGVGDEAPRDGRGSHDRLARRARPGSRRRQAARLRNSRWTEGASVVSCLCAVMACKHSAQLLIRFRSIFPVEKDGCVSCLVQICVFAVLIHADHIAALCDGRSFSRSAKQSVLSRVQSQLKCMNLSLASKMHERQLGSICCVIFSNDTKEMSSCSSAGDQYMGWLIP